MSLIIGDGWGGTKKLRITDSGQAKVVSENHELQHDVSINEGQAYQVISVDTGITAATETQLHIINTSSTRNCVITFIRMQAITNTASKPVVGEYWEMGFGRTVSSGGTAATPVNMNQNSSNAAEVTVTGINPTMAGTFTPIDRWYNVGNAEQVYNKQGSIILGQNDTFEIRLVSAGTGEAVTRVTFLMKEK
jgi:hypothetical protein